MPQWATFVGITGVVLVLVLVLSYLTQSAFETSRSVSDSSREQHSAEIRSEPRSEIPSVPESESESESGSKPEPESESECTEATSSTSVPPADSTSSSETDLSMPDEETESNQPEGRLVDSGWSDTANREPEGEGVPFESTDVEDRSATSLRTPASGADARRSDPMDLSTGMLLANVAVSQGLFAAVLIGAAVYTGIPTDALGITLGREYVIAGVVLGVTLGAALAIANEFGARVAKQYEWNYDETLRQLLAPESKRGWIALLFGVLPIIAVFEELLFRAALIGVVAAGFGVSPWLLAIGSSVLFAIGHGIQGSVGIVVTGVLGFALATAFVLTGNLLVVIVAHYLVNVVEFVVHEGMEGEWTELETSAN